MKNAIKKYTLLDYIRIPFKHAPLLCCVCFIQVIITAIIPTLQILVNANFINKTILYFNGRVEISAVRLQFAFVVLLIAYQWLSGIFISKQWLRIELRLLQTLRVQLLEKQARLEYKHMENPKIHDLISRVCGEPEKRFLQSLQLLMNSFSLIIRIIGVIAIILTHVWWAAIVILVFSLPMFYIAFKGSKNSYEVGKEVSQNKRRHEYLSQLLTGRDAADERSLFKYTDFVTEKWDKHYETARQLEFKTKKKWFIKLESSSVATAFVSIAIIAVLLNPVIVGEISFGIFASLIQACFSIVQIMSWDMNGYVDGLVIANEYIKEYTKFMQLSEENDVLTVPSSPFDFKLLELDNVSFKYPGTDTYILKNLSLKIENGKQYAFVGKNGAGKTTVVKLITGLYSSYEGSIRINGKDIRDFSHKELKSMYSAIFQDYARYGITMRENIRIGNINYEDDQLHINERLELLGLDDLAEKLPGGLDCVLGRMTEEGQDISGGQWQRIAIARSMVSVSPVKILDEPTAALDPVAESDIYQKFSHIMSNQTTIFISHRLGSTKLADIIYVFDDGKVIEQGTHQYLMDQKATYYEMYENQAGWYR